ncbi:MAG: polyprenyl synthetase family protein [Planctomycetes bacterium]|nr:polyprenyl synthetase family protein [Planctomycetota bacterium]
MAAHTNDDYEPRADPLVGAPYPAPVLPRQDGRGQTEELARNGAERTVKARAPQAYRHDEWRPAGELFKSIPERKEDRESLRQAAARSAHLIPRDRPPTKQRLAELGRDLLGPLGYDDTYLGFAMVMLNNEYWRDQFAAVPFEKRLFSMPHCLKQAENCTAKLDEVQLHCNNCGLCSLADFDQIGKRLGYNVLIAEGTPVVLRLIASGEVEGILGVACLNVLEKAFDRVLQLGIPAIAIPLLRDTCHNTEVDEDWVMQALGIQRVGAQRTRSFVPLLREVVHDFDPKPLEALVPADRAELPRGDRVAETERISVAWMRKGGKRFRPFLTQAAWQALSDRDEVPDSVKRVAAAMEFFHKASLIHDDIEDDDDFRYGTETLHKSHSVPVALNIGDYLLGRGYRIVAEQFGEIGADAVAKIMGKLSEAHVKLAEGQGAELLWRKSREKQIAPLDVLRLYGLKTAPAFDVALYAGVVLGGAAGTWDKEIERFCKHLGVAYQIQNDLKDLQPDPGNKVKACGDILHGRPTILFALALEHADKAQTERLLLSAREEPDAPDPEAVQVRLAELREIYYRHEVAVTAELLAEKQRERAMQAVAGIDHGGMQALFTFLTATLLE